MVKTKPPKSPGGKAKTKKKKKQKSMAVRLWLEEKADEKKAQRRLLLQKAQRRKQTKPTDHSDRKNKKNKNKLWKEQEQGSVYGPIRKARGDTTTDSRNDKRRTKAHASTQRILSKKERRKLRKQQKQAPNEMLSELFQQQQQQPKPPPPLLTMTTTTTTTKPTTTTTTPRKKRKRRHEWSDHKNNKATHRATKRTTTTTTQQPQRRKKGKPKTLHFPPTNQQVPYSLVPWYGCQDDYNPLPQKPQQQQQQDELVEGSSLSLSSSSQECCWYHEYFAAASLENLTNEMEAFAAYVRLRPVEQRARHAFIQHVTDLAGERFQRNHPHVRIQCYGSFTVPAVSLFASDVDLALWGVVPPLVLPTHTRFEYNSNDDDDNDNDDDDDSAVSEQEEEGDTSDGKTNQAKKREARVQRWRDVLAEADNKASRGEEEENDALQELENYQSKWQREEEEEEEESSKGNRKQPTNETGCDAADEKEALCNGTPAKASTTTTPTQSLVAGRDALFEIDRTGVDEGGAEPFFVLDHDGDDNDDANDDNCSTNGEANLGSHQSNNNNKLNSADARVGDGSSSKVIDLTGDSDSMDEPELQHKNQQWSCASSSSSSSSSSSLPEIVEALDDDIDSSDDSADELANFHNHRRKRQRVQVNEQRTRGKDTDLVVHATTRRSPPTTTTSTRKRRFGNKNKNNESRVLVVQTLKHLSQRIRKSPMLEQRTMELRRRARIPIVAMSTKLGFEADIAVGGQGGDDTTQFVMQQVDKFKSFPATVLLLKVLLGQLDLDKPFTGGLGSYRLYVLVARHLQLHLEEGGKDSAGDVLVTFLYRYSNCQLLKGECACRRVDLTSEMQVDCDDASAELGAVFQIDDCVRAFTIMFGRVAKRLLQGPSSSEAASFLVELISATKLIKNRKACASRASLLDPIESMLLKQNGKATHLFKRQRDKPLAKPVANKSKKPPKSAKKKKKKKQKKPNQKPQPPTTSLRSPPVDADVKALLAGYGLSSVSDMDLSGFGKAEKKRRDVLGVEAFA